MNDKAYKFSTRDSTEFTVDAGGSGIMVVETDVDGNTVTLKNTWQEIFDAIKAGIPVFMPFSPGENYAVMTFVIEASLVEGAYTVILDSEETFTALTPDGYPTANIGQGPGQNEDPLEPVST